MRKINKEKYKELFYQLSFNREFAKDISDWRIKFGIPKNGFNKNEDQRKWFGSLPSKKYGEFIKYDWIIQKHKISATNLQNFLEEYIINGGNIENVWKTNTNAIFCDFDIGKEAKKLLKINNTPYLNKTIYIFNHCTLKDIQNLIKSQWPKIKKSLEEKVGEKPKKIRLSVNKTRDDRIRQLYKLSRQELNVKKGEYKEIKISNIIEEELGIEISPENVRKIAQKKKLL